MNNSFTILITGTSKGLGKDLVMIFLKKHPEAIIYATSRDSPQAAYNNWKDVDIHHAVRCKQL